MQYFRVFRPDKCRFSSARDKSFCGSGFDGLVQSFHSLFTETSRDLRNIISRQFHFLTSNPHSNHMLVIAALGVRARRLNKAIFVLIESSFSEDANALLRILIEVVVNGAYLMVCGDKEFKAFVAFPVVAMDKNHRAYMTHVDGQSTFTEGFSQLIATTAAEARLVSGRTGKDSSWTSLSVCKRAAAADATFQHGIFADLATTAYASAHDSIHGNFPAILDIISAVQGEVPTPECIQINENMMLSAATRALLGYALALDMRFQTGCTDELHRIKERFAE